MSYAPPPPPPAPPTGGPVPTSPTPWYRQPGPIFLLCLLVAAAVAIPVLFLVLGGEDEGTAASTSTTGAVTSTEAGGTTQAPGTTGTTQAPGTTGTTQAPGTTGTTQPPTTQAPATTTSTTTSTTTTTTTTLAMLDMSLPATYTQAYPITAGAIWPDPWSYAPCSSGAPVSSSEVDVSYLHGNCVGFANIRPDFEINYSGGGSLLCVYFVADSPGGDTTLVINTASGAWVCDDDSGGNNNPAIRFSNPATGTYDIWLASFYSGQSVSGTLYISETQALCP